MGRALIVLFILLATGVQAQGLLLIDAIRAEPPNNTEGIVRPRRGHDMQEVLQSFGEPARKLAAVGVPPITRWYYPEYVVYFEHDKVLDTVILR